MKEEGTLAYKVVGKNNRLGTNASWYIYHHGVKDFTNLLEAYPTLKKYFPVYKKGEVIKEVRGSAGICCFKSEIAAIDFINNETPWLIKKTMCVIKVKGFGEKNTEFLKGGCATDITYLIGKGSPAKRRPPSGTVFFKKVIVEK